MNLNCAKCPFNDRDRICKSGEDGRYPADCATVNQRDLLNDANDEYHEPKTHDFAVQASLQEASCYRREKGRPDVTIPQKTRIQETAEFCRRMGYRKIGLAFCSGVHAEASALARILEAYDLEVVSVMCKVGGIGKEFLGLTENDKQFPGHFESMCNPIGQARLLNEAHTEFNLVMGLCVGHDSLFYRNSQALCTTIAVKDRLLAHNPIAALYSKYYEFLSQGTSQEGLD